jgi:hypothetical protein
VPVPFSMNAEKRCVRPINGWASTILRGQRSDTGRGAYAATLSSTTTRNGPCRDRRALGGNESRS